MKIQIAQLVFALLGITKAVPLDGVEGINLAQCGRVAQSSIDFNGPPERAVDGKRDSIWSEKSCSHTTHELKPWWRVDLLHTYKVNSVFITNRKDCCSNRINGAEIHIGNSLEDNGNSNPKCAVISSIPPGATQRFKCSGMEGRYVNIVIPGREEYLTLCEVEVYGEIVPSGINLARDGRVTQSSIDFNGPPERAIDGKRDSIWSQKSCSHTTHELKPWWRVDLLKTYKVNSVTITNRKDCCSNRINGAEIHIGNSLEDNGNSNARCAVISSIPPGATQTFKCNGMEGRYVNIVIPGREEYLTLCEVEVYGDPLTCSEDGVHPMDDSDMHEDILESQQVDLGDKENAVAYLAL